MLPVVGVWIATGGGPKRDHKALIAAAASGVFLVLPLVALQAIYGTINYSSFPVVLFGILWLLPTIAIYLASPIFFRLRSAKGSAFDPLSFVLRIAALLPIAIMWFALVRDQMPCFLGVPNCD